MNIFMSELNKLEKINIFKNLFRGRDDVFAIHWEKADKSGLNRCAMM
jgi:hypothetical protein